jgi:hypothetical protein
MRLNMSVAAFLTIAKCGNACVVLDPGQRYESQTPTQNPNWCVVNTGKNPAPVRFETLPKIRMLLGRGVQPCVTPMS